MTDENLSASAPRPPSQRSNRSLMLIGIVVALGFFTLIALNMN
jgi:hypothetical protein